ncbi:DUF305 domain-containing protein [Pseudonocardia sp. GCM10023141]|uniref:DUF305 domain-containing protein n=1 Tax=Pseudonocardia sp. GCM10023141 TaxID=3252653 RepID=UPI00361F9BC1
MNRKTSISMLAVAFAVVIVAGCGTAASPSSSAAGGTSSAAPAATLHNDADVAFVNGMIPHHMQAVAMSRLAAGRVASSKVSELAAQITQAQGPEITQLQGFLQAWNVAAAPTGSMGGTSGMAGMEHGGATSGMMSDQQMQQLGAANGAVFDRMFLQMMIEHHTGAVAMSQAEVRDGQSSDAKALAQKIIAAQQAEITTMQQLLPTV